MVYLEYIVLYFRGASFSLRDRKKVQYVSEVIHIDLRRTLRQWHYIGITACDQTRASRLICMNAIFYYYPCAPPPVAGHALQRTDGRPQWTGLRECCQHPIPDI